MRAALSFGPVNYPLCSPAGACSLVKDVSVSPSASTQRRAWRSAEAAAAAEARAAKASLRAAELETAWLAEGPRSVSADPLFAVNQGDKVSASQVQALTTSGILKYLFQATILLGV